MTSTEGHARHDPARTGAGRVGGDLTRLILDAAHDAFVGMDALGRIVAWNAAAEQMFGRAAADVDGADLAETIIPARFHAAHRHGLERFLATGEGPVIGRRVELVGLRADACEFPVELTITYVAAGEEAMFCAFVRDMTAAHREAAERRRTEAALAAQYEVARVLAEAPDRDRAVPRILEAVAVPLGWAVGEFWLVDEADDVLRCVGTWQTPELDLTGFAPGPDLTLARGIGLPGRVWLEDGPVWVDSVDLLATDERRRAAARAGLTHAVGLPIRSGERVVGILDFLSAGPTQTPADVGGFLTFVSEQVGQFMAREAALAAQAQGEMRFRFLAEHGSDMISRHALDGTYLYASPASVRLYGYTPEELVGTSPFDSYHPDDVETIREGYARALDQPEVTPVQYRRRRKDGTYVWVEAMTRRIANAETGTIEIMASTRDVTARVHAEQELRRSQELLQGILDNTPAVVFSKDPAGRYLFVNQRFEELFDVTSAEVVGRTDEEVWGGSGMDLETVRRNDRHVLATGAPYTAEEVVPGADGTRRTYLSTKFPLQGGDGRPYATCGIAVDITDRKAGEEALRVALAELEQRAADLERSNDELDRFAHVASHDLSAPLRIVVGYLQLLRKLYGERLGEDADELIDGAVAGARRMRLLIDDLLAYAAVGASPRPFAPVDLAAVVRDVRRVLDPSVVQAGAVVDVGPLPVVQGDESELSRLFQNLLDNALKFRGLAAPRIRVEAERRPGRWEVRVCDNGIGVDPAHADRIFAMFGRLHSSEEFSGTGAGLAICKKIVDRHGGTIQVRHARDGGSTFVVTLRAA